MTILRVGSNDKYSQGWDQVFGKKKSAKASSKTKRTTAKASKKRKATSR